MTEPSRVHPALAEALEKRGYESLTQVQQAVLAEEMDGRDLLVSAQTGSGKTVGFGMAMASDILGDTPKFGKGGKPLALIVAPTRELALQVKRELDWLYAPANAKIASCVGGMDQRDERRALKGGVHIVVGTPGRLADHIRKRSLDTSEIRCAVLDEADEMLDMGFRDELEEILEQMPEDRRTLMFSATVPKGIAHLAKKFQNDALRVKTKDEQSQHLDIDYKALLVAPGDEENAISNMLRYSDSESALVFCSTRAAVNRMVTRFGNRGLPVVALSGELSQKERTSALAAMRSGRARVCIATDVAARGLDLPSLDLVIHADLPRNAAALLHRSGRTGRAGRKGISALIVQPRARRKAERLLDDAKIDAHWGKPPTALEIEAKDHERLLSDPVFSETPSDAEAATAAALLEKHGPEAIAAAYVRSLKTKQGAPEELRDVKDSGPRSNADRERDRDRAAKRSDKSPRDRNATEFADDAWVELSVGRKGNAEPRWLIPMLCKVGSLTSKEIGAIRINGGNTHVQLTRKAADAFFNELGADGALEKGVTATRLDGKPAGSDAPRRSPNFEKGGKGKGGHGGAGRFAKGGARKPNRDGPRRQENGPRTPRSESSEQSDFVPRKPRGPRTERAGDSKGPYIKKKPRSDGPAPARADNYDPDKAPKKKKDRHRDRPDFAGKKKAAKPLKPGRKPHRKGSSGPKNTEGGNATLKRKPKG